MNITPLAIPEVRLLRPRVFGDLRGQFFESYNKQRLADSGIGADFVQDNISRSRPKGTVRGLHFQTAPFAQAKLVLPIQGRIFDVAVDLRPGSPSYGRHVSAILDAAEADQIFVPKGFAHGFITLEPDCVVLYKVDAPYAPAHEAGLLWNDPALGIAWPALGVEPVLSEKDLILPKLKDLPPVAF